jgi:hypothetical protein
VSELAGICTWIGLTPECEFCVAGMVLSCISAKGRGGFSGPIWIFGVRRCGLGE